jgi:excisionase family DNA binding protein
MKNQADATEEAKQLLVTVDEAARRLSIGRSHIYEQMQRGRLRSVLIGRSRRILERDLAAFIEGLMDDPDGLVMTTGQVPSSAPVKRLPRQAGRR